MYSFKKQSDMNIMQRLAAPTPPFFQGLRNIGLVLVAISSAVFAMPLALPDIVTQVAGYIAVAGAVLSGVSQTTTDTN
jgi:hypothetical protein